MGMADLQLPVDLLLEILLRLPVKALGRFVCVSKFWETLIRSDDFIRWFSSRSSSSANKQPRFLMAFNNEIKGYQENWYFFSKVSIPSKFDTEPPGFLSSTACQLKKLRYMKPSYAHGLISFLYGDEQVVCNPTTGKSVTLPSVKTTEMVVRSFLGYDPINAQYKVLCLTNVTRFCEHQVLTLGSAHTQSSCSWRTIQLSIPHCALGTKSLCVDGVLYYIASASLNMKERFLAGFDLRSETLVIASMFPEGIGSQEPALINYHGKVALVTLCKNDGYIFTLWVLEDAKRQEWSKERLYFLPRDAAGRLYLDLEMVGASGSGLGEFLYAPVKFKDLYVYFVDHASNRLTSVQLQGDTKHMFTDFYHVFTFLHHVETLMFI